MVFFFFLIITMEYHIYWKYFLKIQFIYNTMVNNWNLINVDIIYSNIVFVYSR